MTNESNIVLNQIQQDAQQLLPHIATHNDFPKPGIVFR